MQVRHASPNSAAGRRMRAAATASNPDQRATQRHSMVDGAAQELHGCAAPRQRVTGETILASVPGGVRV